MKLKAEKVGDCVLLLQSDAPAGAESDLVAEVHTSLEDANMIAASVNYCAGMFGADSVVPLHLRQEVVAVPDWVLQFTSDVVTAAGLLRHGKTDKGLASRISQDSYRLREILSTANNPSLRNQFNGDADVAIGHAAICEEICAQQVEPVAWQFYQDGKWWNGDDRIKDHRKNTEEAGIATRDLYANQPAVAAPDSYALDAVHGDQLPAIGEEVMIHLGRSDKWVPHRVVGYYAWGDHGGNDSLHRVFVRVVDKDGYQNARLLKDVRRSTKQKGGEA